MGEKIITQAEISLTSSQGHCPSESLEELHRPQSADSWSSPAWPTGWMSHTRCAKLLGCPRQSHWVFETDGRRIACRAWSPAPILGSIALRLPAADALVWWPAFLFAVSCWASYRNTPCTRVCGSKAGHLYACAWNISKNPSAHEQQQLHSMHLQLAHPWLPSLSWVCTTPTAINPLICKLCFERVDGQKPSNQSQHAWLSALELSG